MIRNWKVGAELASAREGTLGVRARERRFMNCYSDSSPSGVEWIGDVPSHWDVARTQFVARLESGHTPSRNKEEYWENCTIPWFGLADVWQIRDGRKTYVTETKEKISELGLANSAARLLPKGTVILSRTASVGFSAIMGVEMATTQDFVNWICGPKIQPKFLLYVFRAMQPEFRRLTMGSTHQTIYMPDVRKFSTPLPPLVEQRTIATFLDRETAKIDALIDRKQRLIELLQEKRTALITQAVTQGLDPEVEMKDSGVEWLGEIPAHWDSVAVKYLTRIFRGRFSHRPRNAPHLYDGPYPFLQTGDIARATKEIETYRSTLNEEGRACSTLFPAGTLVMAIAANVGDVALTRFAACFPDSVVGFRPGKRVLLDFLHLAFLAIRPALESASTENTQKNLNIERIGGLRLPVPPLIEQLRISKAISSASQALEPTVGYIKEQVTLLQEYRTALISAAVTGKIDVREAA